MSEMKFGGFARKFQEFPEKNEWQQKQWRALQTLSEPATPSEETPILRIEYPFGYVPTADTPSSFDHPTVASMPLILIQPFFASVERKPLAPQLEAWNGALPLSEVLTHAAQRKLHGASFGDLQTEAFRELMKDHHEHRLIVLSGVVLRHQNADWYPVLDYAVGEDRAARDPRPGEGQGRFLRFSTAEQLKAMAQRLPKTHTILFSALKKETKK